MRDERAAKRRPGTGAQRRGSFRSVGQPAHHTVQDNLITEEGDNLISEEGDLLIAES